MLLVDSGQWHDSALSFSGRLVHVHMFPEPGTCPWSAQLESQFVDRRVVGETGASCYNFHSKSIFHKNMQARDIF